ncbi:YjcZ family sporulation protein [Lederbergia graminis]|uniref:YjcZ family sporulation protein n=1 Tax=Lederbergia graminis TaxID=735518 RepID=A0ABW0LID0_9BACI|nr:YjcZ family sporulation protein [Paenibacillus bovis]HLU22238.1 YjcZ family sporulation protein [Bacillaceae bacterium]
MGKDHGGFSNNFALLVVLFILLIIIGTAYVY